LTIFQRNLFWVAKFDADRVAKGTLNWIKVVNEYTAEYDLVANDGTVFVLKTNKDAPLYKVVTVDISKPIEFKDFIPESDGFLAEVVSVNQGNNYAIVYKRNVCRVHCQLPLES